MVNIILPVISNFENYANFIKSSKRKDVTFFVGVTKEGESFFSKSKFVKLYIFENGSAKEEIINSLSSRVGDGKVILMRKLISNDELDSFIKSKTDITVCAVKEKNKLCVFFNNIWKKIIKFIFDFKFFSGDVSVVAISEKLNLVVRNIPNLSYVTRVNRWIGVTESSVETVSKPEKKEYNSIKNLAMLFIWLLLFLGIVAGTVVYFIFIQATFISVFLWACAIMVSLITLFLATVIFVLNIKTGKKYFKKAKLEV